MTYLNDDQLARLSAYLDHTLDASERARFETELTANPALRAELDAYARVDALARDTRGALPAVDWTAFARTAQARRSAAGVVRTRKLRAIPFRLYAPLAAAAALAVVVTAALFYQDQTPSSPQAPDAGAVALAPDAGASRIVVEVERSALPAVDVAGPGVITVSLSHEAPLDALVTVGPPAQGRILVITREIASARPAGSSDDVETLF